MYAYRSVWGAPARNQPSFPSLPDDEADSPPSETFEMPASEWGSLAHRVMEQVPFDADPETVRTLVSSVFRNEGYSDPSRLPKAFSPDHLSNLVIETLRLDIMDRLRKCVDTKRELRLLGRLDDIDDVVMGVLDVLAICDGKLVVIDYKSGHVDQTTVGDRVRDYSTQLALYAILAAGRLSVSPTDVEAHIIFLDPPTDCPLHLTESSISSALDIIHKLSLGDFTSDPSPQKCRWCDYHDICRDAQ
jgi:ATP-dependent exoDNAse (exonuclease V) beta subunit